MPIIAFTNLKGGVAKTTTAVAVAECLAVAGHKTLVIHADHQCMAGELLLGGQRMFDCKNRLKTLHHLFLKLHDDDFSSEKFNFYVAQNGSTIGHGLENLSVIPCSTRIDDFETNLMKSGRIFKTRSERTSMLRSRMNRMRSWLVKNFDYVIIDCPPSMPFQVKSLLNISDYFVLPCVPDRLSIRGSRLLLERIESSGRNIQPLGTIWSLYRKQNSFHKKIIDGEFQRVLEFPTPFETIIPNATAIAESTEATFLPRTLNEKYTPYFAKIFVSLANEVVERSTHHPAEQRLQVSS